MTLNIVPVGSQRRMIVGEELRLRFRLLDAQNGRSPAGLERLEVLVFRPADGRQGYGSARTLGDGLYEAAVPLPGAGISYLFFACSKERVGYAQLPHLILQTSEVGVTAVSRAVIPASSAGYC